MRAASRAARFALAGLAAALVTGPARAADVEAPAEARGSRDLATLTARAAVLGQQAAAARAAVRWRVCALRRLIVEGDALDGATRARAIDAGTRALARELAEATSLGRERDQTRAEGDLLEASARFAYAIGAPPVIAPPVTGAVVARFGVAPDRATGLLLARPGVRLAAAPGAPVRAPIAGLVALVAAEPEGAAVVLEDGAGWTTIVGGLAESNVAEGQRVSAGERIGSATAGAPNAPPAVSFEVWRGRRPVDPLLFMRSPAVSRAALADPPRLP